MRNLKRALSLALASVMVIGMMVVGTGASYQDVKATDNVEAIEVLQAVGIMTGDENGDFNPDANVTRNEIAVVMSNLLNLDYDYYRGVNPFTDVPDWAAPYVAACAAEGVVAGIGGTLYGGSNNVTAAQAALMIMKALGYFQYQNDFGTDWQIATIRQASYINLFDGINANAETALTRNQIAQLVLNGLKANMVTFTGTVGAEINGVSIGYVAEYTPMTNANKKYDSIDTGTSNIGADDKYYVQLGEELYNGDLKLNDDVDVFGRPARCWEYDGKEIGTYVNDSLLLQEYTSEVTGDMLYDLLTRNTVKTYDLTVVIDGTYEEDAPSAIDTNWFSKNQINRNNDDALGGTGNGVLTQVFVNNDKDQITVAIINTFLALANKDYDAKKDEIGFNVYGIDVINSDEYFKHITSGDDSKTMKVTGEDFEIADMKKDDAVLVTVADGKIQTIADCEVIAGTTVDAFQNGSTGSASAPSAVEIDGTEYKFADAAEFDADVMSYYTGSNGVTNLKDLTYNVYMDAYGYVIGIEEVEKVNNYVFITGLDKTTSNLGTLTAEASAIFLDGTMKKIDVNMTKSDFQTPNFASGNDGSPVVNAWFTYTVNSKDVYTVKEVSNVGYTGHANDAYKPNGGSNTNKDDLAQFQTIYAAPGGEIDNKHIAVNGTDAGAFARVYGTDDTVYLTVGLGELTAKDNTTYGIIDEVQSVITGIGNANLKVWDSATALSEADDNKTTTVHPTASAVGVYALYNDEGDVIAAIVVGEDAGASKNLVYVHSGSIYREKYDATTDTYTWTRKVISNGQEVILTEVGEGVGDLENMTRYTWYQVKYNAEGNVMEAVPASTTLNLGTEFVVDSSLINSTINAAGASDTVLYYSNSSYPVDPSDLKLIGKTLWVNDTQTEGFRVSEDVNVVLIQSQNNDIKTYYETGSSALKTMASELVDRHSTASKHHRIEVSAILEKGVATSVVIRDVGPCDPYQNGDWDSGKTGTLELQGLSFNSSTGMTVTFANKSNSAITSANTYVYSVRVVNKDGGKVYTGNATGLAETTADNSLVKDESVVATFGGYKVAPSGASTYNVELTVKDAAGKVIATGEATLGTI
ncbi:S-layer homology domain-containing protein [Lawsonibacter sp. LCP25S3_G6]|uniref:S-layer homology domain-containing protein n=1 Tax=unclassified Lawsonibacter TaxID=2617946 RepID=UPI003F98BDDC